MKIAYVSCAALPEVDIDEQPLVEALVKAGHEPVVAAWDDDSVDWASFDVAIVRATWNYAMKVEAFEAWIDRVDGLTKLLNSKATLKWNLHKEYLCELSDAGVPIIPSVFVDRYMSLDVEEVVELEGWSKIVIKPTVSAGSFGTKSFDLAAGDGEAAQAFFDEMIAMRDMMIQRYMPSVDTVGETALIVIDGELTHAIEKRPRFDDQDEEVYLREDISDEMRMFVKKVLDAAGKEHLYARVDVMPDDDGVLLLSELELLEPSLFFPYCTHAVDAFVQGIGKYAPVRE
ncbi:MAG: hypothetical protein JKX70_02490 [Phycisphaerales bacterium]|nr:hypothetical protein [Phycisphaerales bacterium]